MTPICDPPYYAVIFTSTHYDTTKDYQGLDEKLIQIAENIEGFIGMDSARSDYGISVSYWKTEQAILKWKQNAEHIAAMKLGIEKFYQYYSVRVCKVERNYEFKRG